MNNDFGLSLRINVEKRAGPRSKKSIEQKTEAESWNIRDMCQNQKGKKI